MGLSVFALGAPCPPGDASPAPGVDAEAIAIRAKHIETMAGPPIVDGVVVIRDGKISEVGSAKDVHIPVQAFVVDAGDGVIVPGLVNPFAQIGLSSATRVFNFNPFTGEAVGSGGVSSSPQLHVSNELYPFDRVYRDVAEAGFGALAFAPGGGVCGGQGALARPRARSATGMIVVDDALLSVGVETSTAAKDALKGLFDLGVKFIDAEEEAKKKASEDAKKKADEEAAKKKAEADKGEKKEGAEGDKKTEKPLEKPPEKADEKKAEEKKPEPPKEPEKRKPDPRTEPVVRVLRGEIPAVVQLDSAAEIAHFLDLTKDLRKRFTAMRLVLVLPSDAWRVLDRLKEEKLLRVVLRPDITFELTTRNRMNLPDLFARAGFTVACVPSGEDPTAYRGIFFRLSELVKYGMDRDAALRAVTSSAADVLGYGDRVGSLQPGREANLVVLDRDPLDPLARVQKVLVSGEWALGEEKRPKGVRR
ncbi:MAG: amidohydrolase family protein [Planctomycetes bacterium]|nr:amidohydrolase family protein [Planctomycetota bacterium]MBI3843078.1 amidohydrolase family protein [Planctomycetota bacterium]